MTKSSYVFGAALAMGTISGLVERAEAAPVTAAAFTFETSAVSISAVSSTGPTFGPAIAESGVGTVSASHAALLTSYGSPGGNGSARSLSANNFAIGDYFQFSVPTTNIRDIIVSFDLGASNSGPKVFSLQYNTGTGFVDVGQSTIFSTGTNAAGATATTNFAAGTSNAAFNISFNLSTITALNNNALASFRVVDAVTAASGGATRIDNFVVAGNSIVAVPEPASLALAAMGLGGLAARRRRQA